eukprot:3929688-Rhodomonas_salina.1
MLTLVAGGAAGAAWRKRHAVCVTAIGLQRALDYSKITLEVSRLTAIRRSISSIRFQSYPMQTRSAALLVVLPCSIRVESHSPSCWQPT